jgi:hypothetical protein
MSNGWAVVVTTNRPGNDVVSETFYARVSDRIYAQDIVRQFIGSIFDVEIEARLPVQSSAFDAMDVPLGTVTQWARNERAWVLSQRERRFHY